MLLLTWLKTKVKQTKHHRIQYVMYATKKDKTQTLWCQKYKPMRKKNTQSRTVHQIGCSALRLMPLTWPAINMLSLCIIRAQNTTTIIIDSCETIHHLWCCSNISFKISPDPSPVFGLLSDSGGTSRTTWNVCLNEIGIVLPSYGRWRVHDWERLPEMGQEMRRNETLTPSNVFPTNWVPRIYCHRYFLFSSLNQE